MDAKGEFPHNMNKNTPFVVYCPVMHCNYAIFCAYICILHALLHLVRLQDVVSPLRHVGIGSARASAAKGGGNDNSRRAIFATTTHRCLPLTSNVTWDAFSAGRSVVAVMCSSTGSCGWRILLT